MLQFFKANWQQHIVRLAIPFLPRHVIQLLRLRSDLPMLDPLLHVPSLVPTDPHRQKHLRESVHILLHEVGWVTLLLLLQH